MLVTLTTDFGVSSPYVAAMKGTLLRVCPAAMLVDITHGIRPQDVRQAAVVLADVTPQFPAGTLHVVVVDPGVGTDRLLIYAEAGDQSYLAPDNGVLSYLSRHRPLANVFTMTEPKFWQANVSSTFHGRDKLAPVAGHLANGVRPEELGPDIPADRLVSFRWNEPVFGANDVRGEVLTIDSFGNVITNIDGAALKQWALQRPLRVELCGAQLNEVIGSYGMERPGRLIALIDSQGRLEVAKVNGDAATELQASPGDAVVVSRT